ncbi:MAG: D-alanine--D-alanine ligase [Bacteroidaceae bacterium]|jgi:D-alanine-D-alanine ligase|nr:D-alanine--D-alanine ligase [Bacteroidaceae bacterium]
MKRNIAVIAGGNSSEREVSLRSANTVLEHLDKELYNPYLVEIKGNSMTVITNGTNTPVDLNDFSFSKDGEKVKFEYAYIIIHGTPGENGILEGYLKMLDIPHSTCGVLASALTFNKFMLNQFLKSFGIRIADSIMLRKGDTITAADVVEKIGLPCFIKPSDGGSSFGTTKVKEPEQIEEAIAAAFNESDEIMIEQFMQGTEVTNGYYKTKQREVMLPVTEVVPKRDFFDYEAKYNGAVEEITPARIPDELRDRIQMLTAAIYKIVGCNGIIRNDYIITEDNKINLLEINTIPGMTETSFIPQQIRAAGMTVKEVLTEIIENSFN